MEYLGTRKPTKEEKAKGTEIVFLWESENGQKVEIMGCTCYESWEQWGAPIEYLNANVDNIEAWRATVK